MNGRFEKGILASRYDRLLAAEAAIQSAGNH